MPSHMSGSTEGMRANLQRGLGGQDTWGTATETEIRVMLKNGLPHRASQDSHLGWMPASPHCVTLLWGLQSAGLSIQGSAGPESY